MIKALCRFLSDACWRFGAERLSLWFLLRSLETDDTVRPIINLRNSPAITLPTGPFDSKVIYEDAELIGELGERVPTELTGPQHVHDIN